VSGTATEPVTIQSAFQAVLAPISADPRVSRGRMFGASGFKVDGKVFAMLVGDRLVLKLPRARVDALVAAGSAARFDPGHGRAMKEWVALSMGGRSEWPELVGAAFRFVGGG
jgi:hypothetical protein